MYSFSRSPSQSTGSPACFPRFPTLHPHVTRKLQVLLPPCAPPCPAFRVFHLLPPSLTWRRLGTSFLFFFNQGFSPSFLTFPQSLIGIDFLFCLGPPVPKPNPQRSLCSGSSFSLHDATSFPPTKSIHFPFSLGPLPSPDLLLSVRQRPHKFGNLLFSSPPLIWPICSRLPRPASSIGFRGQRSLFGLKSYAKEFRFPSPPSAFFPFFSPPPKPCDFPQPGNFRLAPLGFC